MLKLLTVTIPSFNAEKTLARTLESLCVVAYAALLDVIVIDDGSRDGTAAIAQAFVDAHPDTVRLIRKENGGHGSGINRGLTAAVGRYFCVVDADDWVGVTAMEQTLRMLATAQTDLVLGEVVVENVGKGISISSTYTQTLEHGREYSFSEVAAQTDDPFRLHTLLLRTEMLRSIPLSVAEKVFYEDCEYTIQGISKANTVLVSGEPLYHYTYNTAAQSVNEKSYVRNRAHLRTVLLRCFDYRARGGFAAENLRCMDRILSEALRQYFYIVEVLVPERRTGHAEARALNKQIPRDVRLAGRYRAKLALYVAMNRLRLRAGFLKKLKHLLRKSGGLWET
jgi:glycosyltransferase involved in cell wall biosynthesis